MTFQWLIKRILAPLLFFEIWFWSVSKAHCILFEFILLWINCFYCGEFVVFGCWMFLSWKRLCVLTKVLGFARWVGQRDLVKTIYVQQIFKTRKGTFGLTNKWWIDFLLLYDNNITFSIVFFGIWFENAFDDYCIWVHCFANKFFLF